ncbi:sulfatase-like hydrolase/transferase [Candidatus Saccharibacteria bacterium]|nr:sulfatase-like hydrolase/transferase [Candidatus Saccharibacteria bacterium]
MWLIPLVFWFAAFGYELILKHFISNWTFRSVLMVALFSLIFAFVGFILSFLPKLIVRITSTALIAGLAALFIGQFTFIKLFNIPASIASKEMMSGALANHLGLFLGEMANNRAAVVWFLVVSGLSILAVWFFNFSRPKVKNLWRTAAFTVGLAAFITGLILSAVQAFGERFGSPHYLYWNSSDQRAQVRELGLIAFQTIDVRQMVLGFEPTVTAVTDPMKREPVAPEYVPQVTFDLDRIATEQPLAMAKLTAALAGTSPSFTNEFTGAFEGKNLIFIMAESLNDISINPEFTPTLHKMAGEGFVFENFYSPYILSTIGGEWMALTGLMPTQTVLRAWRNQTPGFPLAVGHSFGSYGFDSGSGYSLTEVHFYDRHKTRATLGIDDYKACGSGMDALVGRATCAKWIQSDIKLMDTAWPFIEEKAKARDENGERIPFATYLLTMGGHGEYDGWNHVTRLYQSQVNAGLRGKSLDARVYQASQMDIDRAVTRLIASLRAINELDNTVIVIVGDHYPYMLSLNQVNELSSYERDAVIDINHGPLIIWNSEMAEGRLEVGTREYARRLPGTVRTDKIGSQVDILPTLLNLWGIPFDSRLLMGRDILDPASNGLAVFADRSWISDFGRYYASNRTFVPRELSDDAPALPDNYVQLMNTLIASRFNLSESIVQNNFYAILDFEGEGR